MSRLEYFKLFDCQPLMEKQIEFTADSPPSHSSQMVVAGGNTTTATKPTPFSKAAGWKIVSAKRCDP